MTKQCSACKQTLTLDNFTKSKSTANNYSTVVGTARYASRCKPCASLYAKEWRKRNPKYVRSRDKPEVAHEDKLLHSLIKQRISDAKARAIKYNKAFSIDFEYMLGIYTGQCGISKMPLVLTKGALDTPSIDQIDPALGYVPDNVQWLSWRINRAKGEQSTSDFIIMCKAVLEGATTISKESTLK